MNASGLKQIDLQWFSRWHCWTVSNTHPNIEGTSESKEPEYAGTSLDEVAVTTSSQTS
jgi:hypothetical protein